MGNEGQAGTPARVRALRPAVARWLATLSVRQWLLGAFVLVLALSVPFGGLRAVEPPPTPVLTAGQTVTVEPFRLTVTRIRHGDDLGVAQAGRTEGRYVVVFATVSSTRDDRSVPRTALRDLVRVEGVPGVGKGLGSLEPQPVSDDIAADTILVAADGQPMGDLAPGLSYDVAFIWIQAQGQPVPAQVRVAAYSQTWRASSIDQTMGWFDPTRAAVGTIGTAPYRKASP